MHPSSVWRRVFIVLILLLACGSARMLRAQQEVTASIAGTVVDARGAAVPHANVEAKNQATGAVTKSTADDVGHFVVKGIPAGRYTLTFTAQGFATATQEAAASATAPEISVTLGIGSVEQNIEVRAIAGDSIAGQHALSQESLDTTAPKSEVSSEFIREFTPPTADYSNIIQIVPGTFSYNSNGVGLGQGTIYFRGFPDGDYDITWDGIPFEDTNTPTHHSWVFFPGTWIGSVDFDRSPGTASTIGPSTFGGSINLQSREVPAEQSILPSVSYGSFNTLLIDGQYNTGMLGDKKNIGLGLDVHRMTSDGFETLNDQNRYAGDIKVLYKESDSTTITGYSGVLRISTNTPNNSPYRAQIENYGWNYLLQNNDPTSGFYQGYNTYNIPTDFEYVGFRSTFDHGWILDFKPYTYSYYNAQYYANDNSKDTTGLATGANSSTGFITEATCSTPVKKKTYTALPCAVDKLNSYRKYGDTATLSQTSKYGVLRLGGWYEWATTNRFQYPSNPLTHIDQALPNFHERYFTNSANPFVEYEWHPTGRLALTAGYKFAWYNMALTQYADDGKIVGSLGGAPNVKSSGSFPSNLPSAEANYRLSNRWAVYGQFGKGDEIPPSATFDVAGGGAEVSQLPKPTETTTWQGGSVLKLNRLTVDADYYHIKFQSNYIDLAVTNPNDPAYDLNEYYLGPDSITRGFEGEVNAAVGGGIHVYANGTLGSASYTGTGIPSGLYVADTPLYTQALAVTYQAHGLDLGAIEKRIGDHYNDNGTFHNQVWDAPTNNVNIYLNYTLRKNDSIFNQSKISFSVNNVFNDESILDVGSSNSATAINGSAYYATTAASPLDTLSLTTARSYMFSFRMGIFPNRGE
jgi:iron complex outermembrane receptor protein